MKKPHGLFYLIPIILLLTGLLLGGSLFYTAVVTPLKNIQDLDINEVAEFELTKGSFISLFVVDEQLESYTIEQNQNLYVITYISRAIEYTIQLEVLQLSSEDQLSGFAIKTLQPNSTYTFDDYLNFSDISILESGTYRVRMLSYQDLPCTFGYAYSDYDAASTKLTTSFIVLGIGIVGSIASFTTIAIVRGKSKKNNKEYVL